jgi:protein-S-isoprenylcysteine O-methyltransferase Ste14
MPYLEHTALAWPLPEWVSLIGLAGLAAAGGLVVVCRLTNRFTIGTLSIVEGHALYRAGVYGVVRHPIYAALIGGTLAYGLVFRAPLTAALGALAVYAGFRARIRTEEKMLESHFGEQYVDYRRTTGAFFPRVLPQLTEAVRRRR